MHAQKILKKLENFCVHTYLYRVVQKNVGQNEREKQAYMNNKKSHSNMGSQTPSGAARGQPRSPDLSPVDFFCGVL